MLSGFRTNITDDADNYYVHYSEDDGFVFLVVHIRKPCPLREIFQRAEDFLSSLPRQLSHHQLTPLRRTQKVAYQEVVESPPMY